MIFHKHKWIKIKETYAEPNPGAEVDRAPRRLVEILAFGLTTILWECEICYVIRREEMLGNDIKGGDK